MGRPTADELTDEHAAYLESIGLEFDPEWGWFRCPKCKSYSGDDWSQCVGGCPVTISPYYGKEETPVAEDEDENLVPF